MKERLPKAVSGLSDHLTNFFTPSGRKRSCTLNKAKEGEAEESASAPTSAVSKPASVKERKTASAPSTITEDRHIHATDSLSKPKKLEKIAVKVTTVVKINVPSLTIKKDSPAKKAHKIGKSKSPAAKKVTF
jgi:hypothetical protein